MFTRYKKDILAIIIMITQFQKSKNCGSKKLLSVMEKFDAKRHKMAEMLF